MELVAGHVARFEIDVEMGAEFPGAVAKDAAVGFEAMVERCVGKGGLECDLHFVEAGGANEIEDVVEDGGGVVVEPENETAVHSDAAGLNFGNGFLVAVLLAGFPIGVEFQTLKADATGTFKANENLLAAGIAHEGEQFVVLRDVDVGFGEPADIFFSEFAEESFVVGTMHEAVVVREFDEWFRPDFFDLANLRDDFFDRFQFVARGEENLTRAEFAFVRATAAGLDGDSIVFGRVEQIEARHGSVAQVESAVRLLDVTRLEIFCFGVAENFGPERFAFADRNAGAMLRSFVGN